MNPHLEVLEPGAMTTVQDLGRFGAQALGIPVSGALDPPALRLANALVGNPEGAGCLEVRFLGPSFRVCANRVKLALTGTGAGIEVLGQGRAMIPSGRSVTLERGQSFRIGPLRDSATACLAVAGGFDLPDVFGSQSTYVPGGFGGFRGRALQQADQLPLSSDDVPAGPDLALAGEAAGDTGAPVRVVLGPQQECFTDHGLATFLSRPYRISDQINRMGLRLEGDLLEHSGGHDILSDGVVTGSIQVPGNGLPIILLADRQTTGGYPKIATVISVDLPRLGRARPGDEISFQAVDVSEAEQLRRRSEGLLTRQIRQMKPVGLDASALHAALMRENLVSGVVSADRKDGTQT